MDSFPPPTHPGKKPGARRSEEVFESEESEYEEEPGRETGAKKMQVKGQKWKGRIRNY